MTDVQAVLQRLESEGVKLDRLLFKVRGVWCGRETCTKCPHGPYWYAYWWDGGRMRSAYLGKELPGGIKRRLGRSGHLTK